MSRTKAWYDYPPRDRTRTAAEIDKLDKLSRQRALTMNESLQLEAAIRRQER